MTPNKREMVKVEVDEEVVKELLGKEIKRKMDDACKEDKGVFINMVERTATTLKIVINIIDEKIKPK